MRIGRFENETQVEGPGKRAAIWLQGCSIKCSNCCNPHFINPNEGSEQTVNSLLELILSNKNIEGITILGGEPLDQSDELLKLCKYLSNNTNLGLMLFTGYTWEQINQSEIKTQIVNLCDLVIAGPFKESESPDPRRWIGSRNQTIHFITNRYEYLGSNLGDNIIEIEFVINDDEILINGTPIDLNEEIFTGLTGRENV